MALQTLGFLPFTLPFSCMQHLSLVPFRQLNPFWCVCVFVQYLKKYQDHLSLAFTNPVYALALKLFPWQSKIKEAKRSIAGMQQVQHMTVTTNTHVHNHHEQHVTLLTAHDSHH